MKILIDMSTEHYDGLLNKCIDTWPAEYVTLKMAWLSAGRSKVWSDGGSRYSVKNIRLTIS